MTRLIALAVAFLPVLGCGHRASPTVSAQETPGSPEPIDGTLAITNVAVVDVVAGELLEGRTVVVKDDVITTVVASKSAKVKEGVPTIDGAGKFLVPGLWDMHAHVADPAMPALFLRFGVTGIRHMFSPMRGTELKPADPAKEREAPTFPRVVAAKHLLDSKRTNFPFIFRSNIIFADTVEQARAAVKEIKKLGNDFVKVHSVTPRSAYFAAAKEAKAEGIPLAGHVPFTVTAAEASDAGQLTIEHMDGVAALCSKQEARHLGRLAEFGTAEKPDMNIPWRIAKEALETFDPKKAAALFTKFVTNGTWHTPTLVESQTKLRLGNPKALTPEVERLLPASAKVLWAREFDPDGSVTMRVLGRHYTKTELQERKELFGEEKKLLGEMHKAKVKLLAGTDTPNVLVVPGLSLHEELEIFVQCGLTPAEALRTATCHPAECLKLTEKYGTIAEGKRADLVLLSKNPLADIRNTTTIETVFVGGRVAFKPPSGK